MAPRPFTTVTVLLAALCAAAVPASAQVTPTQPQRPSRGLFGGGAGAQTNTQGLTVNASFGVAYDMDAATETAGSGVAGEAPLRPRSGQFGTGSVGLNYGIKRGVVSGGLSAGAHGRYYPGISEPAIGSYFGSGHLTVGLGSKATVTTSHSAGLYVMGTEFFYGDTLGAGSLPTAPGSLSTLSDFGTYKSIRSDAQFNLSVSTRLGVSAGYNFYANDVFSGTGLGRYSAHGGNAGVSYALAKGLGLRVGYSVSGAATGPSASQTPYSGRAFNGGLDFGRGLSLTRRTTVSFSTGLAGVSDQNGSVRYYFTGGANVSYEIGRSWGISAQVARTADFFQAFGQPMIFDRASAAFGGVIGRRLQVNVGGSVVKGTALTPIFVSGYQAGNASVGLQISLTRELALGAGYSLYIYEFDNSALLPPGVLSRMDRQSVRVSLDVWAPLFGGARRTNASR